MQLWEDQAIVHALKHALQNYDYLEYDEAASKHINALKVKVKADHLNAKRDFSVAGNICKILEKETGRRFFCPRCCHSWLPKLGHRVDLVQRTRTTTS